MSDSNCVFCKLVSDFYIDRNKLNVVYESDKVLAFYSTKPFAEVHIVIISKQHIATIFDLSESDDALQLDILKAVKIASQIMIEQEGACKVEMYLGDLQWTKHLHCHVIYDPSID